MEANRFYNADCLDLIRFILIEKDETYYNDMRRRVCSHEQELDGK